jgi:hypothetical protein
MEVYVFRKDTWHQIYLPDGTEGWSEEEKQMYGSLVVSYEGKGLSKQKSEQLAEAFIFKHKYHELGYSNEIERQLSSISRE